MHQWESQHSREQSGATDLRGYAICTQPRSGSNLLCQYLASTNLLGHPLEYFNGPGRRALGLPDFPDDPRLQLDAILKLGATPNRVYAVKVFASHLAAISREVKWSNALPNLQYVYLIRQDLLGQAISWARALQTEQYRSTQRISSSAEYDADLIRSRLMDIIHQRARWEAYFARTGISPLRTVYEQFLQDRIGHVQRIAAMMDVRGARVDESKIDLVKQRDALSEEWRHRFLKECGDPNSFDVI